MLVLKEHMIGKRVEFFVKWITKEKNYQGMYFPPVPKQKTLTGIYVGHGVKGGNSAGIIYLEDEDKYSVVEMCNIKFPKPPEVIEPELKGPESPFDIVKD